MNALPQTGHHGPPFIQGSPPVKVGLQSTLTIVYYSYIYLPETKIIGVPRQLGYRLGAPPCTQQVRP